MPGPYELYFIRHGLAEDRGDAWPDDTKRPLTDEGMSRMRKAARGLARIGVSIEVVLSSPLVRARQTAEIVASGLDPRPSLVNVDSLAPDGSYAAVIADL
jgi:phosphohistidine phosphatase